MKLNLKIWRQKNNNSKGGIHDYVLDGVEEDMSFLEMLDHLNNKLLYEGKEPVAFDHDCREGICGTCGVMINGRAHGPLKGVTSCQLHMRSFDDGEVVEAGQFALMFLPPQGHCAAAVGVQNYPVRPVAGFAQAAFVRQAQFDPEFDFTAQAPLPELRLVVGAEASGKFEAFAGIQDKREQPDHHPLVGFRRVPGDGQVVVGIIVPVHIGDVEGCLEDGCFERHELPALISV